MISYFITANKEIFLFSIIFSVGIIILKYRYFQNIDTNKIFKVIIVISVFLLALQYFYNIPLKMGYKSDLYVHSACIREISKLEFPPGNAMIDGNAPDIHYGPYIVLLGYVYAITKIDPIISLYFAGIINLILFIYFFFNFIKERFNENIAIFSTLSALFVWGGYDSYAGIYYLADSYNYFYPQGVGYTLLFASLFFLIRAMNNDKYKLYCIISSFLLFTTHILTGVLYFLLVYLYLVSLYISKKVEKKYYLFVFVVPFITIVLSLLWPYYSISYLIKNKILSSSLIANVITPSHESPGGYYFNLSYYAATAGLSIIGIFGLYNLVKNRRLFFPLWFISCILILLNKDIPFYGRFLFFSIFPLHIGCGIIFNKIDINLPKLKKYIILFIVLIVVTSSFCIKIKNSAINPPLDYSFIIKNTEEDSVILSDVYTSFTIPGLTGRKIVYTRYESMFLEIQTERKEDVDLFFNPQTSEERRKEIISKYNVSYLLINKRYGLEELNFKYPIIYEGNLYILYKVSSLRD